MKLGLLAFDMAAGNKLAITEAIHEIRESWVDSPDSTFFSNHRNLVRCKRNLGKMVTALRDSAYNEEKNDPKELRAVYDYILNAC